MSQALGRFLDLASDQMKLTAANMANVDTPGYKTQGFDFEQEFARQLNVSPLSLGANGLGGNGLEANGLGALDPQTSVVNGLVARPDGNNVSMDREGLELAKAQLRFRLGVQLIKGEFSQVLSAIHASDGK
jgi:flagellar basal-body rod protein FlgB